MNNSSKLVIKSVSIAVILLFLSDKIKKEKQRKASFCQSECQRLSSSTIVPEHLSYSALNELSSFQKKPCKVSAVLLVDITILIQTFLDSVHHLKFAAY